RFERSIVKVDSDKAVGKTERYRMIVKEASEQSERTILPIITDVENLVDIKLNEYDHVLFASERNQEARLLGGFLSNNTHQGKVLVLIGPEGGITNREIAILSEKGALPISLGPRILRSETAGIMVLSAFLSQWGE
ncbi:MAG: RsmE family RNA methyltransferase, partial [Candidatus Izemoplasmatales bacterium]|nr:RsmE family RNA methyltransferase [Candidatus Izemoplasmatales bacterium]